MGMWVILIGDERFNLGLEQIIDDARLFDVGE